VDSVSGVLLNGKQAMAYLGIGERRFYALVKAGVIPRWESPTGGYPLYSRLALDEWARQLGRAS
jgi:predicted DNA-binding transcriptional regulator AlpA